MIESSKYAYSTGLAMAVYVLLVQSRCQECGDTMLRGDLFTRGSQGVPWAKVCRLCRPFDVNVRSIHPRWRHAVRHNLYVEI